jgi:tetratricopeptide (TPR) repeat protein
MLAFALTLTKKYEEAAPVWQAYVNDKSEDVEAYINLGFSLRTLRRYLESATAYEAALKLSPDRFHLGVDIGTVYLLAGDEQKSTAVFKKLTAEHPEPLVFNDVGYELADANKQLPLALEYAERAVLEEEEASAKVTLSGLKMEDLGHTFSLGAYWDTLGWVYFRMGNYDKAEKYLDAAWTLLQGHDEADHLTQVHQQQHKNSTHPGSDPNLLRTTKLPRLVPGTANAEFFVMLTHDPKSSNTRVEDVKFASGAEQLRSSAKALSAVNFKFPFPDDGPSHLVRRGILSCYPVTGCSFVLYNLSDVHSVN